MSSYIDGLVQERHNSSVLVMELRLTCINPSIYYVHQWNQLNNLWKSKWNQMHNHSCDSLDISHIYFSRYSLKEVGNCDWAVCSQVNQVVHNFRVRFPNGFDSYNEDLRIMSDFYILPGDLISERLCLSWQCDLKSLWPTSDTICHPKTGSAVAQVMAFCLFSTNPSPEPFMTWCNWTLGNKL